MRYFEKMLRIFPFSQREQPQTVLSIHAIDATEPPLLEAPINGPVDVTDLLAALAGYIGDDVAYTIDSWWDLWQFNEDWALAPARVALSCFGPEFDNGTDREITQQEDLRIDFGLDAHYLPQPGVPGAARMIESNIKSLLRLVHELDSSLPVSRRLLETESGYNFAERLEQALHSSSTLQ